MTTQVLTTERRNKKMETKTTTQQLESPEDTSLVFSSDGELSEINIGYLAGIIDGEGWIGLVKEKIRGNRVNVSFKPYIIIGNTNEKLLRWIVKMVGYGYISKEYDSLSKKGTNRKPHRLLTFRPNQIRKLLPKIMPYLIIKKRQAEIVIKYLEMTSQGRHREKSEWKEIEDMFIEIKELNKKGRNND